MTAQRIIAAECLVPGETRGRTIVLSKPLSLWGGFDLETGCICDVNHPQCGQRVAGRVLVMPGGRGSSSSSSILLESVRLGVHPAAIVLSEPDPILVIGALVAEDLYGVSLPLVNLSEEDRASLPTGSACRVLAGPEFAVLELD